MVKLPPWVMKAWAFTGLNSTLLMLMVRGALPPVIALAAYQSHAWSHLFTTIGYLVAIMTLLSLPIQTRAKFLQAMLMSVIFTCLGAATSLLQLICVITARQTTTHTAYVATSTGDSGQLQADEYNASAATVAGIFLMLYIYLANLIRAYRPALMIPCIQWSIFTICSSIYGPTFPTMAAGESFIRRLLIAFLTGFALATGVSLLVFPMTSRTIARRQMGGVIGLMKGIFATHKSFMQAVLYKNEDGYRDDKKVAAESKKLQGLIISVGELFSKMKHEISFARKEFAFGKYQPKDFKEIEDLLRGIMLPMIGLSTFLGMTRTSEEIAAEVSENPDTEELLAVMRKLRPSDWNEIFELSAEPYAHLQLALTDGLNHISYALDIAKKPKSKMDDEEARATKAPQPGDVNFSQHLKVQIERYHEHRQTVIQRWSEQKGIALPAVFWQDREDAFKARRRATVEIKSKNLQQQLYLQLFAEFVIFSMAKAVLKMVVFADSKLASGEMAKRRFVNPGWRRIRKLLYASFWSDNTPYLHNQGRNSILWVGDALKEKRDPEHLPAVTRYQRITDCLRAIPKILSSPESAFATRAALAAITIGVIAYLRQTWEFFIEQRGIWALIMASISMGANTGVGLWGFALRILGTAVAMVMSIVIYYMGYKQPGAIIPIMFIYLLLCWWFTLKQLRFMMVGLISMVTVVLIIGYELQTQKIGVAGSEKNHQDYWPIYILAPIRLLVVIIGITVAFVWTYMPYPVTTHATLRKDLGESLQLTANFYSAVHTLVDIRINQGIPHSDDKESPAAKVDKARVKVLHKCVVMLGQLREHAEHSKFEPTFGGKFPQEKYDKLIESIQKILHYLYLISYAANSFITTTDEDENEWIQDFRRFTAEISITSHRFTSILCQVSASIINCQALPPYLAVPKPEPLSEKMSEIDPDILSIEHIHEPSYAAFAALTVTSSLLSEEMSRIVRLVKDLVGEVDFSYAVVKPPENKRNTRASRAIDRVSRWVGPP